MDRGNLVLTRYVNESVEIGGGITIKVLEIRGQRVRLSITAPKNIAVDRTEIAIQKLQDRDKQ